MTLGMDRETAVERLKAAARDRWGDEWAVKVTHWADGTHQYVAYHMEGRRTPEGCLTKHQLLFGADGEIHHERLLVEPERLVERDEIA